jgi:hypothetical protein
LKTIKEEGLEIDMQVIEKPQTIDEYVQACHNQIWEHGFLNWFKGKDSYSKTKAFEDHMHTDLAVKHVIFRYEFFSYKVFNSISNYMWMSIVY